MSLPGSSLARRYYRVAKQREADAEYLLQGDREGAALYLAGYVVECMLKALILESTPLSRQLEMAGKLRRSRGRDLEWLMGQCKRLSLTPSADVVKSFTFLSTWTPDLRYTPGVPKPKEVR
jgi:hypothetical protein